VDILDCAVPPRWLRHRTSLRHALRELTLAE
jgi:hypothetical protein